MQIKVKTKPSLVVVDNFIQDEADIERFRNKALNESYEPSSPYYKGRRTYTTYRTDELKELFEELNKHNTKPKVKQKIRNELTRRGVKIQWATKPA